MAVAFLVTCQCDRQCPVSLLRGGQGTDHSHSTQFKHTSVLVYTTPASDCEQANMCTHQWAQCPPTPSLTWLILIPASLSCSLCSTSCFRYVSRQVVEPQLSADTSSALGRTCVEGIHTPPETHNTVSTPDTVTSGGCHAGLCSTRRALPFQVVVEGQTASREQLRACP